MTIHKQATTTAFHLHEGDRIVIEAAGMKPFEAVLVNHLGWGFVHGIWIIKCRRDDGTEFTYDLPYDTDMTVIEDEQVSA